MARPATAAVRLLTGEREPVRLATTSNITLYGLQTIDSVLAEVGDRVLVKNQADARDNGIRTASEGQWYRAADARTARTMQKGTTVTVQEGAANAGKTFVFNTLDPVIGDTDLEIVAGPLSGIALGATGLALLAAASTAAAFNIVADTSAFNQMATGLFWQDQGARIHRMNDRIMVGAATINDGKAVPVVKDWLETIRASTTKNAQVAILASIGTNALLAATRSSDFPLAGGQGNIAFEGWAINDDMVGVQASWAGYFEARRSLGAGSTFAIEVEAVNSGSVVDVSAYGVYGPQSGLTAGLWMGSGGEVGTADASVAIGVVYNHARFRKGIVFTYNSLTGTDGDGTGTGIAMELARGHKVG